MFIGIESNIIWSSMAVIVLLLSHIVPRFLLCCVCSQFDYDNGFGDRVGRFKIDLYISGGDGDCGTWVTSVCDKPERGCHDTRESLSLSLYLSLSLSDASTRAAIFFSSVGFTRVELKLFHLWYRLWSKHFIMK